MSQVSILVVEDDRVVARDIAEQLVRLGHIVVGLAARGDDAVRKVGATRPHLVLMDIHLEGPIDGIEAAREIRARYQIPVIYLSAYADDDTHRRASATWPVGYLVKPFQESQLRAAVEMALRDQAADPRVRDSERRFALRAAVSEAVRALAPRAHEKGLELLIDVGTAVPDALVGSDGRLRQILVDLVGDAVKSTPAGHVIVTVDVAREAAGDVWLGFTVRDTGVGVPRERPAILGALEEEGMVMRGQLVLDGEPGRGGICSFTARFARQADQGSSDRPRAGIEGVRILLVDDDAITRQVVGDWLRRWGAEATVVPDAPSAMDALRCGVVTGRPHAIALLDARMPDVDGLALTHRIRERAELAGLRIVLLESTERSTDLAVDGRLMKPVLEDELEATVRRVLDRT